MAHVLNVTMIAVQSSAALRLADAEKLPVAATIRSAVSSFPAGAWRSVYPVPAVHVRALADDPMPKSSSLAAVVVTLPLVGAVPLPGALVVWSRGAAVSKPLYSWMATRRVAVADKVTVTVFAPAAMILA